MDEFDFEIINLREPDAATDATASDSTDDADHDTSGLVQSAIRNHLSRRQRLLRALALITTVLLALALILGTNATVRSALDSLLHPDTTFANSTAPGAEQFDLVHIAPWGVLHIDGRIVPPAQVLQRFRAIKLDPGAHALDYNAPPFSPLHCTLTVPANPTSDTCPLTQTADDLYMVGSDTARMLDLRAGFTSLSGQQLAALTKASAAGLLAGSPTATVAPGEHYLTATRDIATATQPLQATLLYHLDTAPPLVLPGFPPLQCTPLCFYTHLFEQIPNEWGVLAPVALSWSYATPNGLTVAGPIDSERDTIDIGIPLHITWQHGWSVTPLKSSQLVNANQADSPICVPAQDALDRTPALISSMSGYGDFMQPAPDATSCLIEMIITNSATTTSCYLLYRFGVLLAANDQAHRTFPTLPLASASEQSLARQLATHG